MNYMQEAKDMYDELVAIRRHIHENPEVGFNLPNTAQFVKDKLISYGIEPQDIGENGVTALFGKPGGKTIMLRADMDALPIEEQSGEPFSSTNGYMHACGHDIHTTCLLGVAKLLKENEDQLKGQIKLIFQPAEELLIGGDAMVKAGVLENPKVDAAVGLHVLPMIPKTGIGFSTGAFMSSANNFRIKIKGIGSHGSMPFNGVDPVFVGAKIITDIPEIIARELPFDKSAVVTMGKFIGDGAINVIPAEALIEGTIRTFTNSTREYFKKRFPEMVSKIAETYRATAEVEFLSDCPPLINEGSVTDSSIEYLNQFSKETGVELFELDPVHASEDFAYYAMEVPSFFYNLCNPVYDSEELYPVHHPKAVFDEGIIPVGVASMAYIATRWLEDNQ